MAHPRTHGLVHQALLYGSEDEHIAGCRQFIEAGLDRSEPVLVAVPRPKHRALRTALTGDARRVEFMDMSELGRNPSRIIPAVREWSEGQGRRRCRFIGEPIWPGRSRSETVEATRHEALLNFAFGESPISILCPYDTDGLDPRVIADAERTHPELVRCGDRTASGGYTDPLNIWYSTEWPLPEPHATVAKISVGEDLASLRRVVESYSRMVGLGVPRSSDLVLAVHEVATNALRYSDTPGELRMWIEGDRVVCEISDDGRLEDPLVGRRRPAPDWVSGRGLWLVNQICDLVELRPSASGTTVRLHVDIAS
ncbi:MAG: sensor histidine kinase [Solirubrobacterales bacterium]|nr:sensor histidine kinase [Solirubrobacterales bacterium]